MTDQKRINPALYVLATPIGNLSDITIRAQEVLSQVELILCEDTRNSVKLLNAFNIKNKLVAFHKFNEKKVTPNIIDKILKGYAVALISDAGTPAISDPGRYLVDEAIKKKIPVLPIPGVSSVIVALSVSGFREQFYFYGFLNKKISKRRNELITLKKIDAVLVLFVPVRNLEMYADEWMREFPHSDFFLAREMTKLHESYYRGRVIDLKKHFLKMDRSHNFKGEVTFLIDNKEPQFLSNDFDLEYELKCLQGKMSVNDLAKYLADKSRIPRKTIYEKIIKNKNKGENQEGRDLLLSKHI